MWSLNGNDVEQAKEQLNGRRAAIKARYDEEMKQVEDRLAEIEKFERAAREFMSQFKSEGTESAAEPAAPADAPAASTAEQHEPEAAHNPVREHDEPRQPSPSEAAAEPAGEPTGASRWRLRLNGAATEAA